MDNFFKINSNQMTKFQSDNHKLGVDEMKQHKYTQLYKEVQKDVFFKNDEEFLKKYEKETISVHTDSSVDTIALENYY